MTDSVRHANERHWDYSLFKGLLQTRGNVWNRWRFLKKLYMFLEELNRRIRENGRNFGLPWICIFKNISRLPSHFAFFLDFWHLFSDSDNFFRDPWVPLTFFPAATFAVNHFPIKILEQNIVLTQHSAKANTSPLSEKRRLSHAGGVGVLPYVGYIGMCRCEGYGFQAVYSRIGYINQSVWV